MFTPRNVLAFVIVIAVLSVLSSVVDLLRTPDGDGARNDSYGTRAVGQRALFETLSELGVPTRRQLHPPQAVGLSGQTLVLWAPDASLVSSDPTYLENLRAWIESGGRVVLAMSPERSNPMASMGKSSLPSTSVFEALGLPEVRVDAVNLAGGEVPQVVSRPLGPDLRELTKDDADYQKLARQFFGDGLTVKEISTETIAVRAEGTLASLSGLASRIAINPAEFAEVHVGNPKSTASAAAVVAEDEADGKLDHANNASNARDKSPAIRPQVGVLMAQDRAGKEHCLAAAFEYGRGEVLVLSVPSLAHNMNLASADNAVLLTHLLAGSKTSPQSGVVFDEFYHGLTIRGNPMYLFAQRSFGCATLMLLLLVAGVAWRQAVYLGPPEALPSKSRRSLTEYLDAMSRFLMNGRDAMRFIVREMRSGLVWSARKECGLAPEKDDIGEAVAVLARRDPARAKRLSESVAVLEQMQSSQRGLSATAFVLELQKVQTCLSPNAIKPSAKKS